MRIASMVALLALGCAAPRPTTDRRAPLLSNDRIAAIIDTPTNGSPVLSPDGTRVLYASSRHEAQLYLGEVAHPEAEPRALVTGEERVGSAAFTRDGRAVLFRRDAGANENFHIYRIGLDGEGLVDLTPGEERWRDHPLLPRERADTMVYSQRRTDDYASSVVVQSTLAPDRSPQVVYRDPAPGAVIDVTGDGTRALFLREATSGKQLVEVNLMDGTARQLAPAVGEIATIQAAAYTPDGQRAYVARDRGDEGYTLVVLDLATLAPLAEYRPPGAASIAAIVPSPRGDRVAVNVDAGNHSSALLLDAATLAVLADVETPLGSVYLGTITEIHFPMAAGTFSDDGRRFVLTVSAPSVPDDIFVADAETGALAPLVARQADAQPPGIEASIDEVEAFDGRRIPVNIYLPTHPTDRLPTIVFFHGGPDQHSSLEWGSFWSVVTAAGFAVVEPNIRGSSGFGRAWEMADDRERRPDSLRDVESVNRWVREQPWSDPDRVVIWGASYGGYLVLLTLAHEHRAWRAGVDLCGPSDLTTFLSVDATTGRYVGEFGDDLEELRALSPLQHVDAIRTPLFVYQGENDARVPRAQSDTIVEALRARDVDVEYMVGANEGHTVARRENRIELMTRVLAFLQGALEMR
ncbi:MAG: prolyl oligopeptidase family serine peptidase [Sandaracinaceae bacterium]